MGEWTISDLPSQSGRLALVTGATSGLGLEVTKALVAAGATVMLAARNAKKGAATIAAIREEHPKADVAFETLDTADLSSVRAFADRWKKSGRVIDLLILDAGISNVPTREVTVDSLSDNSRPTISVTSH